MLRELTPQQERFAQEYVKDLNGQQAAIRAGYGAKNAATTASKLLGQPHVKAYVTALKEELREANAVTAQMVVNELAKLGFSDVTNYMQAGNQFKDITEVDRNHTAAVESFRVEETEYGDSGITKTRTTIKMHSKLGALEQLGRHLGIFEKDNQQKTPTEVVRFVLPENNRDKPPKQRRG